MTQLPVGPFVYNLTMVCESKGMWKRCGRPERLGYRSIWKKKHCYYPEKEGISC